MTQLDFDEKENESNKTPMTTQDYSPGSNGNGSPNYPGSHGQRTTKGKNKNKKKNKKSPYKNSKNFHRQGPYAGAYQGGLWQHVYGHPMPPVGVYYHHHHHGMNVIPPLAMNAMNHAFPRAGLPDGGLYLRPAYHGGYHDPLYHARMSSVQPNVNVKVNGNVVSPEKSTLSAKAAPFVPQQWNASNGNDDGTNESKDTSVRALLADVESTAAAKKKRVRTKNGKGDTTPKTSNHKTTVLVTPPPGLVPPPGLEKTAVNVLSPPRLEKTSKTLRKPKGTLPPPPGLGGKDDQVPSTAFLPTALLAATGPVYIEDDNEEEQRSVTGPTTSADKNSNSPSPVTVADFPSQGLTKQPAELQKQDTAWAMMHDWSSKSAIPKASPHNLSSASSSAWQTPQDNKDNNSNSNSNKQPRQKPLDIMRDHIQKKSAWSDPSTVLAAVTQKTNAWSNVASPAVNNDETTKVQTTTASAVCSSAFPPLGASSSAFPPLGVEERQEAVKERHEEEPKVVEEASSSAEEDSPFKISPMDMLRQRHGIHFANTPGKNKF